MATSFCSSVKYTHLELGAGGSRGHGCCQYHKTCLARGELRRIPNILKRMKALERRFQKVTVNEPDTEGTISILQGIKKWDPSQVRIRTGGHHCRNRTVATLRTNRFLAHDKTIDLMDALKSWDRRSEEEWMSTDRKIIHWKLKLKPSNVRDKLKTLKGREPKRKKLNEVEGRARRWKHQNTKRWKNWKLNAPNGKAILEKWLKSATEKVKRAQEKAFQIQKAIGREPRQSSLIKEK